MSAAVPNFADKTIWTGDNLDILRGMNSECVDLIYLDPPFNSNQDYAAPVGSKAAGAAFKDTWHLSDLDVAWMGLIADERPATAHVLRTAGITHGKGMQSYLTMMAVRLLEMHRVLKDTGSIYLHCDPTASHYLKLLMDAVFGGANFRNEVVWSYKRYTAFHHAGDDGFASGSPAPLSWPLAPDVGLVNLDLAEEGDTVLDHELTDLLEHPPGRLVGNADLPFKLLGRYARPGGSHEEHGMEPRLEGSRGLVEDGVRRGGYLSPTEFATVDLAARDAVVIGGFSALGAGHTVGPAGCFEEVQANVVIGELGVELLNRVLFHEPMIA